VKNYFDEHHNPTVGGTLGCVPWKKIDPQPLMICFHGKIASYFTYSVSLSGKSIRLEIWDTAGS
jgi:hypothetical protein